MKTLTLRDIRDPRARQLWQETSTLCNENPKRRRTYLRPLYGSVS